jgi:hypothetical protein
MVSNGDQHLSIRTPEAGAILIGWPNRGHELTVAEFFAGRCETSASRTLGTSGARPLRP